VVDAERERLELDWIKVVGSALAATSSAVLLSTLGAAGTIIGAALGSVVITAGGSLYSHYLELSRKRVAVAQQAALRKVATARSQVRKASSEVDDPERDAGEHLEQAEEDLQGAAAGLNAARPDRWQLWRDALRGLPWKRIGLAAAALFLAVMGVITVFELTTGRAVSAYTGGSDPDRRSSVFGGRSDSSDPQDPDDGSVPGQTDPDGAEGGPGGGSGNDGAGGSGTGGEPAPADDAAAATPSPEEPGTPEQTTASAAPTPAATPSAAPESASSP
jgi:hypothetical protein